MRQAYANYLVQFAQFYQQEGITITGLGFTNEPDLTVSYHSMRFTDAQIVNFINVLGPTMAASGLDMNLVCCDAASWNREVQYTQAIEASSAVQWVDIHAGHSYVSPARSPLPTSKTTWMSEYALPAGTGFNTAWDSGANSGLALANDIHDTLTQAEVNAYLTWFGASRENTAAPIQLNGPHFTVSKRLWATAAYSRLIRPDSLRASAQTSGQLLKVSAFRNADGSVVVNLINNRSTPVSFDLGLTGVPSGTSVTTYRTDNQNSLDVVGQSTVSGSGVSVDLPQRSLTTLVLGSSGGTQPPPPPPPPPPPQVPPPPPPPVAPPPPPPGGCTASYTVVNEWSGGFQGEVTVSAGSSAISGWRVTWTYASGQTITQHWNADVVQSGANVTADNLSWNGPLGPGASTSFGFLGNQSGTNNVPTLSCTAT